MMISHLVKANKKSYSFRTTIPRQVVEALQITSTDDAIQWRIEEKNGEVYARVKKLAIS